jgi:dihydroorotase
MNTYLVKEGHIDISKGIEKMSARPAYILGLDKGTLSEGADADIAIFDPDESWTVDARASFSKGKNCVFDGKTLSGKCHYAIVGGALKYERGQVI